MEGRGRCEPPASKGDHLLGSVRIVNCSQTRAPESHTSIVMAPSTHVFPRDWSKGQRQTNSQGVSFPFLDNNQETSEMFLSGKINSLEPDVVSSLRIPPTF